MPSETVWINTLLTCEDLEEMQFTEDKSDSIKWLLSQYVFCALGRWSVPEEGM